METNKTTRDPWDKANTIGTIVIAVTNLLNITEPQAIDINIFTAIHYHEWIILLLTIAAKILI